MLVAFEVFVVVIVDETNSVACDLAATFQPVVVMGLGRGVRE